MIRILLLLAFCAAVPLSAQAPTINATPASLDLGTTIVGTTGTPTSFDIDGGNLLADITITPPTGVEIRAGAGGFQSTALTLTQAGGTVAITTIEVRTSFTATTGQTFSDITCVAGAAAQNVTLTGTVVAQPVITVVGGPLAYGTVWWGNPSTDRVFTVAGADLLDDITVTAPLHVELSTVTGGPYFPSLVLTHTGGVVASTTLFARVKSTAPGGTMNANITASSASATNQYVGVKAAVTLAGFAGGSGGGDEPQCSTSSGRGFAMLLAALVLLLVASRARTAMESSRVTPR
jgi:hypothetical protein